METRGAKSGTSRLILVLSKRTLAAYVASKFLAVCGRAAGYDFEGPLLGDKAAHSGAPMADASTA